MKTSRRKLIKAGGLFLLSSSAGATLPPAARLASLILRNATTRADNLVDRNFVSICLFAAPSRWVFDQFLQTRVGQSVNPNPMTATRLTSTNGVVTGAEYATITYKNVLVPALWGTQVHGPNGMRAMSDLLENMIVFRGFGTGVDGHPGNFGKQFSPLPSAGSTTGQMADHSNALVKAVQFPGSVGTLTQFASLKGLGPTAVNYDPSANALSNLFSPFTKRSDTVNLETLRKRYGDYISAAQKILSTQAQGSFPGMDAVNLDQGKAIKTIRDGIEDLDAVWGALHAKYVGICQNTFRDLNVPGYTDLPILSVDDGVSSESPYSIMQAGFTMPANGFDLRQIIASATVDVMAQSFALTEFVLTRGLSNAIELGSFEPQNLIGTFSRTGTQKYASPVTSTFNYVFDQHSTGQIALVFMNSCLFRAISAGMLELISALKGAGIFNKTVIQVTTDFGRAPRESGGGADHGFNNMVSSIFTGMQTGGPLVLGNILRDGSGGLYPANYSGTFGMRTPTQIQGAGSMLLTPSHVASSLAVLFGYAKNPWANVAPPLIAIDGSGRVVSKASAEVI